MINFSLGFIAGALAIWIINHIKQRRLELWQINNTDGDIEIKGRYIEKISEIHKLLSEIAAGTKSRYRKPAKAIIDYINRSEKS